VTKGMVDTAGATEAWAREWTVTATASALNAGGPVGFYAGGQRGDANPPAGRSGLLYLQPPTEGVPAKIERNVHLGRAPKLNLVVAGNSPVGGVGGDWQLVIKVNGTAVGAPRMIDGAQGWQELSYDLSAFTGRDATIVIEGQPTGWYFEYVFEDSISLTDGGAAATVAPAENSAPSLRWSTGRSARQASAER